ncbi:K Homology domain-containing protein [Artemisia annua]|uniref:K Homology domain-containing protein n=1 Tax=Artemisia annua TaxID=35608 RepID=A0A2U1NXT4_ARTAN|nr:K Homology domain-containing protein [Artemisia annua]
MNELPFISLPIYTAATTTSSPPPSTTPPPTVENRPKTPPSPLTIPAGNTCFRLLCHASRINGVMGILNHLQNDTSAKVRVEHAPPSSVDRVISVVGNAAVDRTISVNEESELVHNSDYCDVSVAQEALVRVYERVLSVTAENEGEGYFGNNGKVEGSFVSCRLLADTSAVGYVIGRGGKVVEKIRMETGCKIKFYNFKRDSKDKLPSCALPSDELVEIEGEIIAVKKALVAVTSRLQEWLPLDKPRMVSGRPYNGSNHKPTLPNGHGHGHMDFPPAGTLVQEPVPTTSNCATGNRPFGPSDSETFQDQREIVFWILCSGDRIGGVIGNSGTIIKALEKESGASISVQSPGYGSNERLITIRAFEDPESQNSPAQNAVLLVFNRSVVAAYEKGLDSPGTPIAAKVVITPQQRGCLLGKGGSIMADMRKVTGAFIKIVSGNEVPSYALENDHIVLITGEFVNVQNALYCVTHRLRNDMISSRNLSGLKTHGQGNGQPSGQPSFGMHPSMAAHHHSNQRAAITQSMDNLRLFNNADHPSSSGPWQSQARAGSIMNGHDVNRGPSSVKGGIELGRGGRSAIVTNTTMEIAVPENVIELVYGENGSNLTRIRQISGAKVVVHEPDSGTPNYTVVIAGTPNEAQSAQSLLQAFILAD